MLNKKQKTTIILLLIVLSGMVGWFYEFIFYYLNSGMKEFYMRGGNFLPWINIYAYGAFLILLLTENRKDKPLQVFLISMISTGILEFLSGYILYGVLGWTKCWDYNQEAFTIINFGGYASLRSILVFGLSGLLLVYVIVPLLKKLVQTKYLNTIFIISIVLCGIFILDELYNLIFAKFLGFPKASYFYQQLGFHYITFK